MAAILVDKKAKKEQIVKAAIRAFLKKGFARTTISDIAKQAGTGKGTIYEYFNSKDEIIHFSFNYFIDKLGLDFEEVISSEQTGEEKIKQIFHRYKEIIQKSSQGFIELMFDFWAEAIKTDQPKNIILKEMNRFYLYYRNFLAGILEEGIKDGSIRKDIQPKMMASLIIGMMDGILVQWILDKKNIDINNAMDSINSMVMNGIGKE